MANQVSIHTGPSLAKVAGPRAGKKFRDWIQLPEEIINQNEYKIVSLNVGDWTGSKTITAGFQASGFMMGAGSAATAGAYATSDAGGATAALGATDNAECYISSPNMFIPTAGAPITFLWEGRVNTAATHHAFIGLCAMPTTVAAAGPLTASTGAQTAVDQIGIRWTQAAAPVPTLTAKDGAGTADDLALTGIALADGATPYDLRFAMQITDTKVNYYIKGTGQSPLAGNLTLANTTLTSLAVMGACLCFQNHGAAAHTYTMWRFMAFQKKTIPGFNAIL